MFKNRKIFILTFLILSISISVISCSNKSNNQRNINNNDAEVNNTEPIKFNKEEFDKNLKEWQSSPKNLVYAYEENNKKIMEEINTDREDYNIETFYNLLLNSSTVIDKNMPLKEYKENVLKAYNTITNNGEILTCSYEVYEPKTYGLNTVIIDTNVKYGNKTYINEYWLESVGGKWFVKNYSSK